MSHLDVESSLFADKPHGWIQWKGTDVCMDMHCDCGYMGHVDASFAYYYKCPSCGQVYEVGSHVTLYKVDKVPEGACEAVTSDLSDL